MEERAVVATAGYVAAVTWWIGVIQQAESDEEGTICFLHPHDPSTSFVFPRSADVITIAMTDVLANVHPITDSERT